MKKMLVSLVTLFIFVSCNQYTSKICTTPSDIPNFEGKYQVDFFGEQTEIEFKKVEVGTYLTTDNFGEESKSYACIINGNYYLESSKRINEVLTYSLTHIQPTINRNSTIMNTLQIAPEILSSFGIPFDTIEDEITAHNAGFSNEVFIQSFKIAFPLVITRI